MKILAKRAIYGTLGSKDLIYGFLTIYCNLTPKIFYKMLNLPPLIFPLRFLNAKKLKILSVFIYISYLSRAIKYFLKIIIHYETFLNILSVDQKKLSSKNIFTISLLKP